MVSIHLLVKTKQKFTVCHHARSSGLRSGLGSIGRVMCGRVIIGGIRCIFAKLTIQWTNAFINDKKYLALFIS